MPEASKGRSRLLRVFLCHSSGDKPAVRDLCQRLRVDGFEPWLDEDEILPGQDWKEEIPQAVRACDVVVVCLSRTSVSKDGYLQKELREALSVAEEKPEGSIFIIPVRLEEVDVPRRLTQWQWADLFQQSGYQRLVRTLTVRATKSGMSPLPQGVEQKESAHEQAKVERATGADFTADHRVQPKADRGGPLQEEAEPRTFADEKAMANFGAPERFKRYSKKDVGEELELQLLEHYEVIRPIYRGNYGVVLKCLARKTGELCVVKRTDTNRVNLKALTAIQKLDCPNLAKPRRIWELGSSVFEELPYVGGVRLSQAVARGIGGLRGSVLSSFQNQITKTLSSLHESGIIHRDIHPDNIYMVTWKPSETDRRGSPPWDGWGFADFLLAWVIADTTFATLVSESSKSYYSHSPYTAEEQETTGALPASDMYAFGATMYYGITGREVPSFQTRKLNPKSLTDYPTGDSQSMNFSDYLASLLSLDPRRRQAPSYEPDRDTHHPQYTGTLRVSETVLLKIDMFQSQTRLLEGTEALRFYRQLEARERRCGDTRGRVEAEYWVRQLQAAGIRDEYKVGGRVVVDGSRFGRHGRSVGATIEAVTETTEGTRLQVSFENETALIDLWEIEET